MVPFGSMVYIKIPGKLQGGIMAERWLPAVWLGKKWSSDEHVVSLASGKIVRARDARPFPDDEPYDQGMIQKILGTPQNPSAEPDDDVIHESSRAPTARPEDPVSTPMA